MRIWVLTKFYQCPEFDWPWPVCAAYGEAPYCPWHSRTDVYNDWAMVKLWTSPVQIEAMKQDPRVVPVGGDWDPVPQQVIEVFSRWLDPNVTYQCMGQLIAKLGQWEPCFLHEPNPR
jgi:hypothetical protein